WRLASGAFPFSDNLARFFNFKSQQELIESFKQQVATDSDLVNCDLDVWSTALIITYLKILCWKYRSEWEFIIDDSEYWLSTQMNNLDDVDRLYEVCRKFIMERFRIETIDKDTRITIRTVKRVISYQNEDGCVDLNEKVAKFYGFQSVEEFKKHLMKYFKTERVTKLHINIWVTAYTIWYLRLVTYNYRQEWIQPYEKSYE
ncbi:2521_t:CDS:2, partial [Acaulospora morrowiae]